MGSLTDEILPEVKAKEKRGTFSTAVALFFIFSTIVLATVLAFVVLRYQQTRKDCDKYISEGSDERAIERSNVTETELKQRVTPATGLLNSYTF